eukprot:735929_1
MPTLQLFWFIWCCCSFVVFSELKTHSKCRKRKGIDKTKTVHCSQYNDRETRTDKIWACVKDSDCIWQNVHDSFPLDDPKLFSEITFSPEESFIDTDPTKSSAPYNRQANSAEKYSKLKGMTEEEYSKNLAVKTVDLDGVAYTLKFNPEYLKKVLEHTASISEAAPVKPHPHRISSKLASKSEEKVETSSVDSPHLHVPSVSTRRRMPWRHFPADEILEHPASDMGFLLVPSVLDEEHVVTLWAQAVASVYHVETHREYGENVGHYHLITSAHNLYKEEQSRWNYVSRTRWWPGSTAITGGVLPPYSQFHTIRAAVLSNYLRGSDDFDKWE